MLDACAMIAYLQDEDGAEAVEHLAGNEGCMAHAVIANLNDAKVVTSDHHEFDSIKEQGVCEVEFIR